MEPFIIFPYSVRGKVFVEAYPLKDRPEPIQALAPIGSIIVYAPSRNNARRQAYTRWIRSDGAGFNKFSRSPWDITFKEAHHG
jgi:hypothetical protein